jgi:MerR family transcriptional regulator/heat shock protein HspR
MAEPENGRGVYGISVAAELSGIGIQTLRLYETRGLIRPARSDGGTRLYSADDLRRASHVVSLVEAGLNLAGIARVLELEAQNAQLRAENEERGTRNEERGTASYVTD